MTAATPATRRAARLRLLFAIDSLGSGGAQRQMVHLAIELARRGHSPVFCVYHIAHTHFAPELAAAGIQVRHVPKRSRFSLAPAQAMRRMLRHERFDAVVAYLPTPSVYAELATRMPGRPPLIVSERSAFLADGPSVAERLRAGLHWCADLVVVNSNHHRAAMTAKFPWLARRLHTIWNGVDLEHFHPDPTRPRSDALLAVASIRYWKNARALARALVLLHETGRPVPQVRWAGKPESAAESRRERHETDAILAAAGLGDRWEWLGERRDVPELLRTHAALVHTSLIEGLPNAVCEALASGMPVLAGAVGDQPSLIQDGASGFLFDPESPESIAAAIGRFQHLDRPARARMQAAARAFAEERLSLARVADEYEAAIGSLAATFARRRTG